MRRMTVNILEFMRRMVLVLALFSVRQRLLAVYQKELFRVLLKKTILCELKRSEEASFVSLIPNSCALTDALGADFTYYYPCGMDLHLISLYYHIIYKSSL
jgi:hypothetical protein